MNTIRMGRTVFFLVAAASCPDVTFGQPSGQVAKEPSFLRPDLMRRFDADGDAVLNLSERRTLRAAFGGIDVPMLPATPPTYQFTKAPDHVGQHRLQAADTTPSDNPIFDSAAALGRVLFYDRQLSSNNTVACASCHRQQHGFADPRRYSSGFAGGLTGRSAMGLVNLRFTRLQGNQPGMFWDERAPTLEEQVLVPIQDSVEMGMDLSDLENRLQALPYYPPLFKAAFGSENVSHDRIARAVAQFVRAMVSFDSRFDRAALNSGSDDYSHDFVDFTPEENLGKSLFINGAGHIAEIGCAHCHIPPTFNMPKAFNNGLDLHYEDQGLGARDVPSNDPFTPDNGGKFKAPSLRNIALTAPYMHDGRFSTLEQVVQHYSSGVHPHPNLGLAFEAATAAGETSGFQLTPIQQAALVAFLKTLTDERLVSDPRFSDPFVRLDE